MPIKNDSAHPGLMPYFDIDPVGINATIVADSTPNSSDLSNRNTALGGVLRVNSADPGRQNGITGIVHEPSTNAAGGSGNIKGIQGSVALLGSGTRSGTAYGLYGEVDIDGGTMTTSVGTQGTVLITSPGQNGTAFGGQFTVEGNGANTTAYGVVAIVNSSSTIHGYGFYADTITGVGEKWAFYSAQADIPSLTHGAWYFVEKAADEPTPPANQVALYARDNGAGKTQLCAHFSSGSIVVLATDP